MEPPSSALASALAALLAGVLAFALAGGSLVLMIGPFEGWVFLASFAAAPALVIALLPFGARVFAFVLGLLALAGTWLMDSKGPDNPLILLPWIALCFAGSAIVAELCVRTVAFSLRARSTNPPPADRR